MHGSLLRKTSAAAEMIAGTANDEHVDLVIDIRTPDQIAKPQPRCRRAIETI
jgi:hypothetical protein